MSTVFTPLSAALDKATAAQTLLANSKVGLFKSDFVPTPSSILADYTANECDYSGYAQKTVVAWNDPILAPGSGWMILSPLQQFVSGGDYSVQNSVGGIFVLTAADDLYMTIVLGIGEYVPMGQVGQGYPFYLADYYPTG